MTSNSLILIPMLILIAWSMIMWIWMYATRIPAIQAVKMKLDPEAPNGQQMSSLPAKVRWKADNYTHLMEQPTIFYALIVTCVLLGEVNDMNIYLAWAYVLLRIIHSLVQALVNIIELRFAIFVFSNIPLFWLTLNNLTTVIIF